jgi:hypothetical protein
LLFSFPLVFDQLLRFFCSLLFFFLLLLPNMCVVNALIKGEIESLCGSWTCGWSLPGVMSD